SVGKEGIAETDLHPSGWVLLDGQKIFVVSEGEFIDKGQAVIVLSVDGNRVLVRTLKQDRS
ncbi:MAG: NfeD family protein, partial [Candidatus Marinimicrobia bacterium]|nr:NfeD family protein [Candidatus Neomarinimicrobiota bacterium]